jgi:hypothetical protein
MSSNREGFIHPSTTSHPPRFTLLTLGVWANLLHSGQESALHYSPNTENTERREVFYNIGIHNNYMEMSNSALGVLDMDIRIHPSKPWFDIHFLKSRCWKMHMDQIRIQDMGSPASSNIGIQDMQPLISSFIKY